MSGKEFFGSLVVKKGLATPQDVMDCLKIQRRAKQMSKKNLPLGEIMVFQGILSPAQLYDVLKETGDGNNHEPEDTMFLSEVLLEKGFVTSEQLLECLDVQWKEDLEGKEHRLLVKILKDKGYLSEEQFQETLNLYQKSGTLSVIALKDVIRFQTNMMDANPEIVLNKGVTYYTYSEKFRTGTYNITWYVHQEKGYRGPFTAEFLLKSNTAIAPIVDEEGNGKILYMQISG